MNRSPLFPLPGALALLALAPGCFASTWVITDSAHPVDVPADVRLIHLDRLDHLEVALSQGLPSDPGEAQAAFRENMSADSSADISRAHQDIVDAWSLGITRIPAVVVDHRYVVYGDPNLGRALAKIERFRKGKP